MTTAEELISAMKDAGTDEPKKSSGGSGGLFLEILKSKEGKWLTSADFKEGLDSLNVQDKYISNKLNNLKKKAGVEFSKDGRVTSYKYTTAKFEADNA